MTSVPSRMVQHLGKWRLAFLIFLIVYGALLLFRLDYASPLWDEAPHLIGGLLLNRGQIQVYAQQYMFYPPLFDATIALSFILLGPSVFSARLVAVFFGILTLGALFEYVYRLHGPRNALFSSILLASMPGFFILSKTLLIETMLLFFFSTSLFLFFLGMYKKNNILLLLSGVTIALGIIVKYQILIAGLVILASLFLVLKDHLTKKFTRFFLIAIIALAVVLALFLFLVPNYFSVTLADWLYAIQVGTAERSVYSTRFPLPIFYFIEMTYPYSHLHPISLPLYILGLFGLAFWLWRRRGEDKFSLIWFFVVYSVFTLIPNRSWRYVISLFPILAMSASDLILSVWDKIKSRLPAYKNNLHKTVAIKIVAPVFIILICASLVYSWRDAYVIVEDEPFPIPTDEATQYVIENSASNEATVVLFTSNQFSIEIVKFYFSIHNSGERNIWEYPEKAVDAYTPVLNETYLIKYCESTNVKYLLLFEHGNQTYFNSEWTAYYVLNRLIDSGQFISEAWVGTSPQRIFIIRFMLNS
jgi:4-amino-4-deoxy-L-arabinose transferase-like glycosyltransferase